MRVLKKNVWPYQISLILAHESNIDEEISVWCNTSVGYRFKEWYSYSENSSNRVYAFKDEATLLVFTLKWGNYGIKKKF